MNILPTQQLPELFVFLYKCMHIYMQAMFGCRRLCVPLACVAVPVDWCLGMLVCGSQVGRRSADQWLEPITGVWGHFHYRQGAERYYTC